MSARLILPLLRAYAAHVGAEAGEAELRSELDRRLSLLPVPVRVGLAAGAVFVAFLSPLVVLGRLRGFAGLADDEREELLSRLQRSPVLPLKAAYLGVKSLLLGACYGRPAWTSRLGYGPGGKP